LPGQQCCGNGVADPGEQCGDLGFSSRECCVECLIQSGADCNEDGDPCTLDLCDNDGRCQHPPDPWSEYPCTTTTTLSQPDRCGHPVSSGSGSPTASDVLYVLQTAVGVGACDACVCDIDGDGVVTVRDALGLLFRVTLSLGELGCPPCAEEGVRVGR
jgi:hypothetical protein